MGEFLGGGKPCLSNSGVGDVYEDFKETGTGITLPVDANGRLETDGLDEALQTLMDMAADPEMAARCRAAAEARFSLKGGVAVYSRIYDQLAARDSKSVEGASD